MANSTGAFGLRPDRYMDGTPWNGATIECYIGSDYGTALYVGDPVLFSTDLSAHDSTGKKMSISKSGGTDGDIVWGVITSFAVDPDGLGRIYNPASTERVANVCIAADNLIFTIRGDGGGTPSAVFIGQNAVMIASTAGSTTTGLSGMMLDEGTTTAPSANQSNSLLILGIHDVEGNTLADNAVYDVLINTNSNATGRIVGVTST